ncbi:polyprenyl synthetase family protein [Legionella septentrionalis]|uniref:Polyprenyl synthetase family protein n=1 Tax=Legionella septentrionalis TaxID=2498109 RepID=A0A3S0X223_9GAMM|nr:farnesyl diphosphate synthase [Legionella septentrionalis]RUQ91528.1 polyprenyl synthetase family protein [Legionella septentrionalis]
MTNQSISAYVTRHENLLLSLIETSDIPAARIKEAILYSLFPGGKRLRPLLVYLCGELIDVEVSCLDFIAIAIELTHCYSLVHDDLPAMDDDDIRRGKPSCHRAFDEATAILVGDGMQALAIDVLLTHLPQSLDASQVTAIVHELVKASGPAGMVSGQSLDLSELTLNITEEQLKQVHQLKTGKLISACVNMVVAAANPTLEEVNALRKFSSCLGLVFQMQDDYLDQYGTLALGKGRASDAANQKKTFAALYDQHQLANLIKQHYGQAEKALALFGNKAHNLLALIHSLQQRH